MYTYNGSKPEVPGLKLSSRAPQPAHFELFQAATTTVPHLRYRKKDRLEDLVQPVHPDFRTVPLEEGFDWNRIMLHITKGWKIRTDRINNLLAIGPMQGSPTLPTAGSAHLLAHYIDEQRSWCLYDDYDGREAAAGELRGYQLNMYSTCMTSTCSAILA
jgi:hypothetical protein